MQILPYAPSDLCAKFRSHIALGINARHQKHVALIYRAIDSADFKDRLTLLHLGWHRDLRSEPWNSEYSWLPFEYDCLDEEVQITFGFWAALVGRMGIQKQDVFYSVKFDGGQHFDRQSGQFLSRKDGSGLTCATFLLALFNDYGIKLVNFESWPKNRRADSEPIRHLLHKLFKYAVKGYRTMTFPEWLLQWRNRHHIARFRPEEVFVTPALYKNIPLDFGEVELAGEQALLSVQKQNNR